MSHHVATFVQLLMEHLYAITQGLSQLGAAAGSLITEVDLTLLDQIKQELPLLKHRRKDIYALRELR